MKGHDHSNSFDKRFDNVAKSRQQVDDMRSKLIQGVLELNEAKRANGIYQRELLKSELELSQQQSRNKSLKEALMIKVVEREMILSKRNNVKLAINKINQHIENAKRESDTLLCSDGEPEVPQQDSSNI